MAYDPNSTYIPPRRAYYEVPPAVQQQQRQQQAPYRNGYGNHGQEQYGNGHYGSQQPAHQEYGNGYDQGYGQDYNQGYEQGYSQDYNPNYGQDYGQWNGQLEVRQPPSNPRPPRYDYDEYGRPRQEPLPKAKPSRQADQYGQPQQRSHQDRRREDRHYDPRYQQRPEKTRPSNGYDQPRQERGRQPSYNNPPPSDSRSREQRSDQRRQNVAQPKQSYEAQSRPQQYAQQPPPMQQQQPLPVQAQDSRPNPRNGRMYPGESQPQPSPPFQPQPQGQSQTQYQPRPGPPAQMPSQQSFDLPPPPRIHDTARPSSAPHSGRREASPGKMTMDEWKATERARLHAASAMPDTVAWDNAFPTFPTKRDRSKARSGTSSARASGELPRPATASSNRHERHSSKGRTYSDSASALNAHQQQQQQHQQQQLERPVLDRNAHSFGQMAELPVQPQSPTTPMKLPFSHHEIARDKANSPVQHGMQYTSPEPVVSPPMQHDRWQSSNASLQAYSEQHPQPSPELSQSPAQSPPPTSNPTRTYERAPASFEQEPRPAYLDHQPLSPAPLQIRPATAHAQRSAPTQSPLSPPPLISQSEVSSSQSRDVEASQSWNRQAEKSYGQSLVRSATPPRTRDQEIEDEMPDFDSAAPGGMSLLHKRSQQLKETPVDNDPPPMPAVAPLQVDSTPIPVSPHSPLDQRSYAQPPAQAQASHVDQNRPVENRSPPVNGYVYGQPGQSNARKIGATYGSPPPPQQQQFQQPPPQQQFQQPPPQQYEQPPQQQYPPRPPFADERPRRSMDDARQMPYRQAPPTQQRAPPNDLPQSRQQYPPQPQSQARGGRNGPDLSVQTSWANSSRQDAINSAPPTQQTFRDYPPRSQNGAPPARQRSNPDQPGYEQGPSSPDALPHHPVPVRPGHTERGAQPAKPPPQRNYDNAAPSSSHQRQGSSSNSKPSRPVTSAELSQLQSAVNNNPSDNKRAMLLVKKFVEASTVLASDNGRADRQQTIRNRDRYIKDADKLLRRLVAVNYPDAQFYLADSYGSGTLNLDPNPREAFKLYQAAAKAGHAQAAYRTAMCCELGPEDGGTTKDFNKAVQWYRRGAALGDTDSMFKVGIILLKGLLGQPRNVSEAVTYIKRCVDQSSAEANPQALFQLAQLYESSNYDREVRSQVPPDDTRAFELFQTAAATGHKSSQFRLGQAYEYGQMGATIDNRASITWYTKAAAQGQHEAELALSGWYLTGAEGILQQSDQEAYLWARKAAASEPPLGKAMFAMGYFTETGIGCPKSLEEAKKWYARAAAYKFPKAQERLEELRRNGSKNSRPINGRLNRKDQKRDEENCVVM